MIHTIKEEKDNMKWIETALGNITVALMLTDKDGIITLTNDKACTFLGLPCEAMVGKELKSIISLWDVKRNAQVAFPLSEVVEKGLSVGAEDGLLLQLSDGRKLPVNIAAIPLRDEEGTILGMIMTLKKAIKAQAGNANMLAALERASAMEKFMPVNPSIFVRSGGKYVRVLLEELLWVEAMENYVQLQTTKEKIIVHATLKSIADGLLSFGFQRIHRSFIVKVEAIESIEENQVLINGMSLPIGKSYRGELLEGLTLL